LPIAADDASPLRDGRADLALGFFRDLPAELRTQALFDDRLACVARRGHPKVKGRVTLASFLATKHVVVAPRGKAGTELDDALAARGVARRTARSVPFYLAALDLVAQSDCVVTMSERLARSQAERFGLQVLKLPLPMRHHTVAQVWHPRLDADPAHLWLRQLIARLAKPLRRL
jgi:DNA-binding transcriptional LysR family regulator